MGCFFGCFRVKDDNQPQPHLISDAVSSKSRQDSSVSRNKLASLLLSEDKESSPCEDAVHHTLGSTLLGVYGDGEVKELKDEAKFLKACGTLLETPAEIRKVSEKGKDSHDGDSEPSRFYSWLPSTSIKKLHWEEQPDQAPVSPVKLSEELGKESGSLVHKPSSCMSKGEKMAGSNYIRATEGSDYESPDTEIKKPLDPISNEKFSSVTPELLTVNTQSRNKCVRFECESDMGLFPSNGGSLKQFDSPGSRNGSERSPYPTPLNLTDEMQTPGTIYPANLENIANGKNARIRSQYVYPVFNPVVNFSQWKALKEEDSNPFQQLGHPRESLEQSEHASPQRTSVSYSGKSQMMGENIFGKELKVDASLAHWVKPPSSPKDDRNQNTGARATSSGKSSKMSDGDRPILGMVAAHWNDEDTSRISPKWWDGNGIPNSTNKYKEDQRVSWHATPFEERLEKALSEESHVYQRKNLNEIPIDFEGNEESDTAISRLQSSAHPESVVSF